MKKVIKDIRKLFTLLKVITCNKMIKIFNIFTSISECWYQMFDYHITWVCVDRQGKDRMVTK